MKYFSKGRHRRGRSYLELVAVPGSVSETLCEEYTYRVNVLLEEGREDLAADVAAEFARLRARAA